MIWNDKRVPKMMWARHYRNDNSIEISKRTMITNTSFENFLIIWKICQEKKGMTTKKQRKFKELTCEWVMEIKQRVDWLQIWIYFQINRLWILIVDISERWLVRKSIPTITVTRNDQNIQVFSNRNMIMDKNHCTRIEVSV